MVDGIPEGVGRLLEEREERRRARDFAAADALRDRIREAGFDVEDTAEGPVARPIARAPAVSVQWVVEGWPEDAVRGIEAFRRHHPDERLEQIVVDATEGERAWPADVRVVRVAPEAGWAAARNEGIRAAGADVVVLVDGSVEPEGDVLTPLRAALEDPVVGVAGPFGLVTTDLREFRESPGPAVDAIEGYLMAFRTEVLRATTGFDEGFRFYRAADVDLSFRVRALGLEARVVPVPVHRHEHRAWHHTPPAERERLSRRNFYRFLDRWRDRTDLLVERNESESD